MNFYDVFTTLTVNPSTQKPLQEICDFVQAPNELEPLKKALWKRPSRAEHPGMFPFDEETGRIYDSLWKAAQAENYSTVGRLGRWLLKSICPPADDEGMAAFHRKARADAYVDETHNEAGEVDDEPKPEVEAPPEEQKEWDVSDDGEEIVIGKAKPANKDDGVKKRSKKGD